MRYDDVVTQVLQLVAGDATIEGIIGAALYESGERDFEIPSLEWTLIVEIPELEVYHTIQLQFDPFARTKADLLTLQGRLYQLLHKEMNTTLDAPFSSGFSSGFGPVAVYLIRSRLLDIRSSPTKAGLHTGSMDFEFTPIRERYL